MGTHPIFESDFDCLTELIRNRTNEKETNRRKNRKQNRRKSKN